MHRSSHYDRRRTDRSTLNLLNNKNNDGDDGSIIRINNNNINNKLINSIGTDEARYNLATRIMSNGVEVIVAGDKSTLPGGHPNNHLRILTTSDTFKLPLTLAPSTLKDQMHLMLPQTLNNISENKHSNSIKNTQVYKSINTTYSVCNFWYF